jgi:hypothetical protein
MRRHSLRRWFFCCVGGALAVVANIASAAADGGGGGPWSSSSGSIYTNSDAGAPPDAWVPDDGPPWLAPDAGPRFWRGRAPSAQAHRERRPLPRAGRLRQPAIVRAFPPPAGETRFRRAELLVEFAPGVARANIDLILRRHRLTESEAAPIALLRTTMHLWRISDARDAASVIRELGGEPLVASAQPNYVYLLQQNSSAAAPPPAIAPQYALGKLRVDAARALATGDKVLVAVVDTAIDEAHPDLAGVVEARFDAIGGVAATRTHGTSIAGAIAAHGRVQGVAPQVRILAARAFETTNSAPEGTTFAILKGIDWAAQAQARVVNMSFAGPLDPAMHRLLAAAFDKGVMLVAAAGNAGRKSAPLYPAADEKVLAVTATDADDKLFDNANVGRYIAVAAPGVDVLLPAPDGNYELETGTSVSAALVSGVAALIIERRPAMPPAALRKLIMTTARPLGAAGDRDEFGAGLVDAWRALSADSAKSGAPPAPAAAAQ